MFGAASKTKNLICGLSVEPMSLLWFSIPAIARNRVNPFPPMSYTSTDGFLTRTPSPFGAPTRIGSVPARSPAPSRGVREASAVTPPGPSSIAWFQAGRITSGMFEPFS